MSQDPRSLVEAMLVIASTGPHSARPRLDAARQRMTSDLTLVVTGRRGAGKTGLVNGLLGMAVGARAFSAEQRRVEVFSGGDQVQEWATSTRADSTFLEGRRVVEVPDAAPAARPQLLDAVRELCPDVLVHVAHEDLRADEVELLRQCALAWGLGVAEVIVVLTDPRGTRASSLEALRSTVESTHPQAAGQIVVEPLLEPGRCLDTVSALEFAERYAVARRTADALDAASTVSSDVDDSAWSARLQDDLEHVALSPECHVLRERWALDSALSGLTQLDKQMLADLRATYLLPVRTGMDRAGHLRRAARWQAEASRSAPRTAEVARTVVRSCQLRLAEPATSLRIQEPGRPVIHNHRSDYADVLN